MPTSPTSPEACDRLFVEHVNAGDLDALLSLYEPTCNLVRRDGSVAHGHVEIRAVLDRLLAMQAKMSTEIMKVVQAGEDRALVYDDWRMSARDPTGTRSRMPARRSRWCGASRTEPGGSSSTTRSRAAEA